MNKLEEFFLSIKGKKITVLGIGISNRPLIDLLVSKGAAVTACDKQSFEALGEDALSLSQKGVKLVLGEHYLDDLDADLIVKTPGMRIDLPQLIKAKQAGACITSEMELFFQLCPCKTIAVTGSDGKSTTTAIINELLMNAGYKTRLGGNIGKPLLPEIESIQKDEIMVIELSSFQLMTMRQSPDIAVITNVTPNHLDMHKSMDEYVQAKQNIFLHQKQGARLVLNNDNEITRSLAQKAPIKPVFFSLSCDEGSEFCFDGSCIRHSGEIILSKEDILLPGIHNIDNYMAAIAAVWGMVPVEVIKRVAASFGGLKHRLELVRELEGVRYYNDSIASSPTRTKACFNAFDQKIILIAGGYDKNIPFDGFGDEIIRHCKAVVLCGDTANKIKSEIDKSPLYDPSLLPVTITDSFKQAVMLASAAAKSGDAVVLSPACASFDKFKNFEQRGEAFRAIVNSL